MKPDTLLQEIREANLTYLMLAQKLIASDRSQALFRLGLPEQAADLLAALSPAQVLKLASGNTLLCRMRVDDNLVWQLLSSYSSTGGESDSATRMHANILMAGRFAEAI
jgi:flagellar transcriptional activator FlhD